MAKVTVTYWSGTTQYTGTASTYRGALRIASRSQNTAGPRYWEGKPYDSRELYDDGQGLVRADGSGVYVL